MIGSSRHAAEWKGATVKCSIDTDRQDAWQATEATGLATKLSEAEAGEDFRLSESVSEGNIDSKCREEDGQDRSKDYRTPLSPLVERESIICSEKENLVGAATYW